MPPVIYAGNMIVFIGIEGANGLNVYFLSFP